MTQTISETIHPHLQIISFLHFCLHNSPYYLIIYCRIVMVTHVALFCIFIHKSFLNPWTTDSVISELASSPFPNSESFPASIYVYAFKIITEYALLKKLVHMMVLFLQNAKISSSPAPTRSASASPTDATASTTAAASQNATRTDVAASI